MDGIAADRTADATDDARLAKLLVARIHSDPHDAGLRLAIGHRVVSTPASPPRPSSKCALLSRPAGRDLLMPGNWCILSTSWKYF
jgi:hypothetical protein